MRSQLVLCLVGVLFVATVAPPALAETPYDSSVLPFRTKQDPRPDPRKVDRFIDDHPRQVDGLYQKRFMTSGHVLDWLSWLKADWNGQREARIELNRSLIDLRKSIPEEGAILLKAVEEMKREDLIQVNEAGAAHDALYAFTQARKKIADAEAEVKKAQSAIAAANASVDAATAGLTILVSTNELETLAARREAILKKARESNWFAKGLEVARTAIDAVKDVEKAAKTIGLDYIAKGFDMLIAEHILIENAHELAVIEDRQEVLKKLVEDKRLESVKATLTSAQATLEGARAQLFQAAIRRTIALADARHQLVKLALLEERKGNRKSHVFRALYRYQLNVDGVAKFVNDAAKDYYAILQAGPSARAGYLYVMMRKDIADVEGWGLKGDFTEWVGVARDTRDFLGRHDEWFKRESAQALGVISAHDARAHWKLTERVASQILLVMEKGGT